MYQIKVSAAFAAAHFLRRFLGKCETLHGHNWKVEASIEGEELDHADILFDFGKLKDLLRQILEEFDHCHLNQLPVFTTRNPSSELIAQYIYNKMKAQLPPQVRLLEVAVWESEGSQAAYRESALS
jgi:6-pyruvoyltetrahydropterin/6-carboxytetrahydropterin synthase